MKLNIQGRWIELEYVPAKYMDGDLGSVDDDTIQIREDLPDRFKANVILHEIMHLLFVEKDHLLLDCEASLIADALWWNGMFKLPEDEV